NRTILSPGCQGLAVGEEGDRVDKALMPFEHVQAFPGSNIPDARHVVTACRREQFSVRGKRQGIDVARGGSPVANDLLMALQCEQFFPGFGLAKANGVIDVEREEFAVRREGDRVAGAIRGDLAKLLSCSNSPYPDSISRAVSCQEFPVW